MKNGFGKTVAWGAIAVGAALLFLKARKGHSLQKSAERDIAHIYGKVEEKLSELSEVTRESYNNTIERLVDEYMEGKEDLHAFKEDIIETLKDRWTTVKATLS